MTLFWRPRALFRSKIYAGDKRVEALRVKFSFAHLPAVQEAGQAANTVSQFSV